MLSVSSRLAGRISKAMGGDEHAGFRAKLILQNPDAEYRKVITLVSSVTIVQDFLHSYMDQIAVSVQMTPEDYRAMYANSTNLEATLMLNPCDLRTRSQVADQPPIIFETRVLVDKLQDMDKIANPNLTADAKSGEAIAPYQHDILMTVDLQLMDKGCYDTRRVKLNATFTECDVESVIHWVGGHLGAEKCSVVPPDNKQTYKNLVVDPFKDISNIFPFLQARYGIYSKGLGYYYTDKTLYVYPAYDHDRNTSTISNICNIVGVTEPSFRGNHVYHNRVEDDIWIMSLHNSIDNISQRSSENAGNVTMSLNPETSLHKAAKLCGDGVLRRDSSDLTVIQAQNTKSNTTDKMLNANYQVSTSNVYAATSKMAAGDAVMLSSVWDLAMPKSITPGMHCVYHYDAHAGDFKVHTGRVLSVVYKGFSLKDTGDTANPILRFVADILAHLSPEQQSDPQTQFK